MEDGEGGEEGWRKLCVRLSQKHLCSSEGVRNSFVRYSGLLSTFSYGLLLYGLVTLTDFVHLIRFLSKYFLTFKIKIILCVKKGSLWRFPLIKSDFPAEIQRQSFQSPFRLQMMDGVGRRALNSPLSQLPNETNGFKKVCNHSEAAVRSMTLNRAEIRFSPNQHFYQHQAIGILWISFHILRNCP